MWSLRSRGLNLFRRKHLLSAEHLLCAGCARSRSTNIYEGKAGSKQHFCEHCALPAPSLLRLCISLNNTSCGTPGPRHAGWWQHAAPAQDTLLSCLSWPLALCNDRLCNRHVHQHGHKEGWQDGSFLSFSGSSWPQTPVAAGSDASEW